MTLEAMLLDPEAGTKVVEAVCAHFGITYRELCSKDRSGRVCHPRHIAAFLMRERGMKLHEIGRTLNRDHTTIIAGVKKIEKERAKSPAVARAIDAIRRTA